MSVQWLASVRCLYEKRERVECGKGSEMRSDCVGWYVLEILVYR